MNHHAIANLGFILACNARIEAMKAANMLRADHGKANAYGEDSFALEQAELSRLARDTLEYGWQK